MNETVSYGLRELGGNITGNMYSAYTLTNSLPVIIGALACITVLGAVALMPKVLKNVIVGYICLFGLYIGGLVAYATLKTGWENMDSILNAIGFRFLMPIGNAIIDYWSLILITLPVAYGVGLFVNGKLDEREGQ